MYLQRTFLWVLSPLITHLALACENECMQGVTNAFIGNYSYLVDSLLSQADKDISQMLIHQCGFLQLDQPPHGGDHRYAAIPSSEPMGDNKYLAPVRDGYHSIIARSLQHNIFPGYFHGKCAPLGTAVPGCPNPDCPVVCGTPGSMVHFYSKLVSIAFETVRADLWVHSKPGSGARKAVERRVLARASGTRNGRSCRSKDGVRRELRSILTGLAGRLAEQCGGPPLSKCNWAQSMKQYILTFP